MPDSPTEEQSEAEPLECGYFEFFSAVSPKLEEPRHLHRYIDVIERAADEPIRAVVAAPPQHGKTVSTLHALLWWGARHPGRTFAYATYNEDRANEISRDLQELAHQAGYETDGTLGKWSTFHDGRKVATYRFTSVTGTLTGAPVSGVLVIDDPISGWEQARSAAHRQKIKRFYAGTARTRLHATTAVIVMATRWHVDDLSGHCVNKLGWPYVNIPAIAVANDNGRSIGDVLWPHHRPLSLLKEAQEDDYIWNALYQGNPQPEGAKRFRDQLVYYQELPAQYALAHGIDLAYSKKTSADFSVAITMAYWADRYYIVDVIRRQVQAPDFCRTLENLPTAPMLWYAAGTETGSADFIKDAGVPLSVKPTTADKFVRSIGVCAAWNAGKIMVPEGAPWVDELLDELKVFTGNNDPHDDQVDALAAVYDLLKAGTASTEIEVFASYRGDADDDDWDDDDVDYR